MRSDGAPLYLSLTLSRFELSLAPSTRFLGRISPPLPAVPNETKAALVLVGTQTLKPDSPQSLAGLLLYPAIRSTRRYPKFKYTSSLQD